MQIQKCAFVLYSKQGYKDIHLYGYLKVQSELGLLNHNGLSAFMQLNTNTSHVNTNTERRSVASLHC